MGVSEDITMALLVVGAARPARASRAETTEQAAHRRTGASCLEVVASQTSELTFRYVERSRQKAA
jgi:hypothetical protein